MENGFEKIKERDGSCLRIGGKLLCNIGFKAFGLPFNSGFDLVNKTVLAFSSSLNNAFPL